MTDWRKVARHYAEQAGYDPDMFERQIGAESNFDANARSPAGATGIAQIMPETAKGWGVDPNNPRAALSAAAKAMAKYYKQYGNYKDALTAYNAGPGRVGKPLYAETAAYIKKITQGADTATRARNVASTSTGIAPTTSVATPSSTPSMIDVISNMNNAGIAQGAPNVATGVTNTALSAQQDALRQSQAGTLSQLAQLSQPKTTPSALASTAGSMTSTAVDQAAGTPTGGGGEGSAAALSWAKSKIGFKETGKNSGGLATYLNGRFNMQGAPWCAMFTSAAVTKGGAPKAARSASVAEIRAKAQQGVGYRKGILDGSQANPGDLIMFANNHIAMVERVEDGKLYYVGGNQSDGVTQNSTSARGAEVVRPLYGRK